MSKPRPKYIANRQFMVGRFLFKIGDPVTGGRPLDLALARGYVDSTSKRSTPDPSPEEPATADQQETPQ